MHISPQAVTENNHTIFLEFAFGLAMLLSHISNLA